MRQREFKGKSNPNPKATRNKLSGSGYSEKETFRPRRKSTFPDKSKSTKIAGKEDLIRLNKFIASTGLCSRREADKYISDGLIKINGKVITELGTQVAPKDEVKFGDQSLRREKLMYILLNKPKDFVTTTDDPKERKTVMELIKKAGTERVYPVGRLDKNTTGVLLLTNDGALTTRLTHPKYKRKKIYHIFLNKPLTSNDMKQIAEGVELEDGIVQADKISYVDIEDKSQVGMEIHSGKNRVIRRIFEQLGYIVVKLDRVWFAGLTKKSLKRGQWRYLSQKEIDFLKMGSN
ncbi:pseudouridine synthase [Bacteroidota bacterium]